MGSSVKQIFYLFYILALLCLHSVANLKNLESDELVICQEAEEGCGRVIDEKEEQTEEVEESCLLQTSRVAKLAVLKGLQIVSEPRDEKAELLSEPDSETDNSTREDHHHHPCGHGLRTEPLPGLNISIEDYWEVFRSITENTSKSDRSDKSDKAEALLETKETKKERDETSTADFKVELGSSLKCDQGNISALTPSEKWLIRDFENTSRWGRLCFDTTQGATNGYAQSLFILGMKAVSNFEFDYCQVVGQKLLRRFPTFVMGYSVRALCNSHLLWNYENPIASAKLLAEGRKQQQQQNLRLSDEEEQWYASIEALNNYQKVYKNCSKKDAATATAAAKVKLSMPCRFLAFLAKLEEGFAKFPQNANFGAFVLQARIAVGVVSCTDAAPGKCPPLESGQDLAKRLYAANGIYTKNPAFLHFSLHSFDYPYKDIYTSGLTFARAYPKLVNASVHSLHMSSHIFQRAGKYADAAAADQASVDAADEFSLSGALKYEGGGLGKLGRSITGTGFGYNAGNTYHSLEYLQNEVLQACQKDRAALLSERMDVASYQLLEQKSIGAEVHMHKNTSGLSSAWYDATTFYGWSYRMEGRLILESVMLSMLGDVGLRAESRSDSNLPTLPLPLSWQGATEYSNRVYAPQSEAGLWTAIALQRLLGNGRFRKFVNQALIDKGAEIMKVDLVETEISSVADPWEAACGGAAAGMETCGDVKVQMAMRRISEVQEHYLKMKMWYEANLTEVLKFQVASAAALAAARPLQALKLAQKASDLEFASVVLLLPSSTSLYFIPGTAFGGIMALAFGSKRTNQKYLPVKDSFRPLLKAAANSFEKCLSPQGRPNLSICLLGQARTAEALGKPEDARKAYHQLMANWLAGGDGNAAKETCSQAWEDVTRNLLFDSLDLNREGNL